MELFEKIESFTGDYRFLSNFWLCKVEYDGDFYPSAEHAYQAAKCEDRKKRVGLQRDTTSPGAAKKWGQTVPLRPGWEGMKLQVMKEVVRSKFSINAGIRALLLRTGTVMLIEGNYWMDTYWGVCDGVGDNHLGRILMEVRAELAQSISRKLPDFNDEAPQVSDS
jgi:ribA/ribD-fused uncharacterized protein